MRLAEAPFVQSAPVTEVILLGKGSLAIHAAERFLDSDEYELARVVPVVPEPAWTDSLGTWAHAHDVPVIWSGHYDDIPRVHSSGWRGALLFSVFYDRILPAWLIEKCDRVLNLHNGPLPRYRGVSPINWALKNEEDMHGVTIHEITPGIDDGPIVAQVTYSIYPELDEVEDVYARALAYGAVLFDQTLPLLDGIVAREQEHAAATYYSGADNERLGERRSFTRAQSQPA